MQDVEYTVGDDRCFVQVDAIVVQILSPRNQQVGGEPLNSLSF